MIENPVDLFDATYETCARQNNGAFIPEQAADILAQYGLPRNALLTVLCRPETASALYPDVEHLRPLAEDRDQGIVIWTQGELTDRGTRGYQAVKVVRSGLVDIFGGHKWKEKSQRMGIPRVVGGLDKHAVIPVMVAKIKDNGFHQVVIVDDRQENLLRAQKQLQAAGIKAQPFHIIRGRQTPEPQAPVRQIKSMEQLPISELQGHKSLYLFDLDYTLIDHKIVRKSLAEKIGGLVA